MAKRRERINISQSDLKSLNQWEGFFSFIPTDPFKNLINCEARKILVVTGNQFGKTASAAMDYPLRILGKHPVEWKNIRPDEPIRTFRLCSETLPSDSEGGESRNTIYPALRKRLPYELIKKDINARKPVITIKDIQGGPDIYVEFVSYGQDIQATAGVQRKSIWLDEVPSYEFYTEQLPRLLSADGDMVFTLTPTDISWVYDELFEKAQTIFRTPAICEYYRRTMNNDLPEYEVTNSKQDIAVIQAATDDNPTLDIQTINELFMSLDDDTIAMRRYGIFKQVAGRVFKDFAHHIHVIPQDKYFPDGIPREWLHARGIDFHEHNPWAVGWMMLSPMNEAFVYNEMSPSPDNMVTIEIARQIALMSRDYKYALNLIDPLAAKKQSSTGYSTLEDLNRYFHDLKREDIGTGGYWMTWDTKTQVGRDEIKMRLKNARLVGQPFNNETVERGIRRRLPTLWILDHCRQSPLSLKMWRWEEWVGRDAKVTKDLKDKANQRWSHFNMVWEGLFKHPAFKARPPNSPERLRSMMSRTHYFGRKY